MSTPPASPCINICRMDPLSGLCIGCQRTLEEIAGWSAFDNATRLTVLERVAERRQASAAAGKP
ncbi:DUF1289 domain-containing protein [Azonexus hydrophilus]|uniref:DUF1289 domain-containing protein n=1 Tax=Azonexus hydrophilus TaxID=418702 RepID=UPI00048FAC5D|nr:DUF1289 domain-containing protein [Azonexus hydrophilus]